MSFVLATPVASDPPRSPPDRSASPMPPSVPRASTAGSAAGPRILLVVPHTNFWFKDYDNVRWALQKQAVKNITIASSSRGRCEPSRAGFVGPNPVVADLRLGEARPADFDAVVFVGANPVSDDDFLVDPAHRRIAHAFMQQMLAENKWVVGICSGNAFLADAGILRGEPAAVNQFIPPDVKSASGALWKAAPVVIAANGHILTGRDQDTAHKLVESLLSEMRGDK